MIRLFDITLFFAQSGFTEEYIMEIATRGLFLIMLLSAPMLLSALSVGLVIAIIQATTQVQEQTLASVPKMGITFVSLIVCGPWIMDTLSTYATELWQMIGRMGP
jgi:flagellar biosynthetic protein FliQ